MNWGDWICLTVFYHFPFLYSGEDIKQKKNINIEFRKLYLQHLCISYINQVSQQGRERQSSISMTSKMVEWKEIVPTLKVYDGLRSHKSVCLVVHSCFWKGVSRLVGIHSVLDCAELRRLYFGRLLGTATNAKGSGKEERKHYSTYRKPLLFKTKLKRE